MRKCNICGSNRPEVWYKTKSKKLVEVVREVGKVSTIGT